MLQNKNICVSLHSQLNMVPIVQLVRASDCGSECRGFESHWAPKRATSQEVAFFVQCGEQVQKKSVTSEVTLLIVIQPSASYT